VANRAWLHRLFTLAERQKMQGIVLFSDGDPGVTAEEGFAAAELPHQTGWLCRSAQANPHAGGKIQGKVLLIDAQRGAAWRRAGHSMARQCGTSEYGRRLGRSARHAGAAALFSIKGGSAEAQQ
jgi:hypothetical protein